MAEPPGLHKKPIILYLETDPSDYQRLYTQHQSIIALCGACPSCDQRTAPWRFHGSYKK